MNVKLNDIVKLKNKEELVKVIDILQVGNTILTCEIKYIKPKAIICELDDIEKNITQNQHR